MNLGKNYNPKEFEDKIYETWERSGYFNPDNLEGAHDRYWKAEPYSIVMPPPNATGKLHMGHAMALTVEDLMVRYARMQGKKTLWLPGTDHAAIATQNVVEKQIWEAEEKTRHDIGRENLLDKIEAFIEQTRGTIKTQTRKMGASCDWSREKYTLSPELSLAVRTIFKRLFDAKLIYRGNRIVNWCPRCATTLADDEVEHRETDGNLYFIKYPFEKSRGEVVVATTRPETMLGDTAVAVNPNDRRYKKLIGHKLILPLVNRELEVVSDEIVDLSFGTGAVKVTPGHDLTDFEIGRRHNLKSINILSPDGKIDEQAALDYGFEEYGGLDIMTTRKKIVAQLNEAGFIQKIEPYVHNVGYCYRCSTPIEPIVSKQWFVNVDKKIEFHNPEFIKTLKLDGAKASLKEMALAAINSGAIRIVPQRFAKTYLHWMHNLRDWNISRQIWFGHRIPVWYCDDCENLLVAIEDPKICENCSSDKLTQDPDTLDTWFSSSLWTFSALGWPNKTENDLLEFHPTSVMETGYDILFFWVARMVLMTGFAMEDVPFKTVYLHGLVRDKKGRKMSKSLGNGVDPVKTAEEFGADALRLALILGSTPGNDIRIYSDKLEAGRNFINKLWNIARFTFQQAPESIFDNQAVEPSTLADTWILAELSSLTITVNQFMKKYQYGLAGEELQNFTWNKFADWYLEIAKIEEEKNKILQFILMNLLKLWHPFIPFVTEHIWAQISSDLLLVQEYPQSEKKAGPRSIAAIAQFESLQNLITGLRNLRNEYRVLEEKRVAVYLDYKKPWMKQQVQIVEKLAKIKLNLAEMDQGHEMPYFIWQGERVYLIIPNFDARKEIIRTQNELNQLTGHMEKLNQQLSNKNFLKKAPEEVVKKLKFNFDLLEEQSRKLKEKLKKLR